MCKSITLFDLNEGDFFYVNDGGALFKLLSFEMDGVRVENRASARVSCLSYKTPVIPF